MKRIERLLEDLGGDGSSSWDKGIIVDQITEKGDVDQTTRLQKENRQLMEKMETLEREYGKVRKALEFIMPLIDNMDDDFKRKIFEKRKGQIIIGNHYLDKSPVV